MTGGQGANEEVEEADEDEGEQMVVHRVNTSNRIQPRDIMREVLESMAQRMRDQPDESLEELKVHLHFEVLLLCASTKRFFSDDVVSGLLPFSLMPSPRMKATCNKSLLSLFCLLNGRNPYYRVAFCPVSFCLGVIMTKGIT